MAFFPVLSSCAVRTSRAPSPPMSTELTAFDKEITGWLTGKHCSNYLLGLRIPEPMHDNTVGKRVGHLSGGSILGGKAPDSDSADALFKALKTDERASYLLVPRYDVRSTGFPMIGTYPIFGKRCSSVRAIGVSVFSGPIPISSTLQAPTVRRSPFEAIKNLPLVMPPHSQPVKQVQEKPAVKKESQTLQG
jgi:hypothetical protein